MPPQEDIEPSTPAVPPPHPELRRLEPLVGTWTNQDKTSDTVYGPGVTVMSRERFYWLEGGYFLVQHYDTVFGDEPAQKGVNYWFYDAEAQTFRIIFFSNNGPFTEDGNRYAGGVSGDTLTLEGPARFQYKLDSEGNINVNSDGTISVVWWLRDDHGEWQPWMENTFRKIDQ
jgi:hypothetical protein